MKYRKLFNGSYHLVAARNRRSIMALIELERAAGGSICPKSDERSEDTTAIGMPSHQAKPSKIAMFLTRALIRGRRRLRDAMNTGSYYVNIYREWFGYTFCCIIIKKKKLRGVLKSVKV